MNIERGDIFLAEMDPARGSKIRKTRPVIVITNDIANMYSPLITVIPLTSQRLERILKFELYLGKQKGLEKESKALVNQLRSMDRSRLKNKFSKLSPKLLAQLNEKIKIHLGLE